MRSARLSQGKLVKNRYFLLARSRTTDTMARSATQSNRSDNAHGQASRDSLATDSRDRALTLLTAEYAYVSQNILLYRHLETFVLAGTGLVATGALAAYASLTAGENPDAHAAGIVLSAAAWGPALLLLVELTALTRVMRASRYISRRLRPVATELVQRDDLFGWEIASTSSLLDDLPDGPAWSLFRTLANLFSSSVGTQLIPSLTVCALTTGGLIVQASPTAWLLGITAILVGIAAAAYGVALTCFHERRQHCLDPPDP
jgi:hypothetical protein